jgi:queuine/archaeosine tRNA-ribosyltransferase
MAGEILAARALTEHNLFFYARLMAASQAAIASRTYAALSREVMNSMQAESNARDEEND